MVGIILDLVKHCLISFPNIFCDCSNKFGCGIESATNLLLLHIFLNIFIGDIKIHAKNESFTMILNWKERGLAKELKKCAVTADYDELSLWIFKYCLTNFISKLTECFYLDYIRDYN